MRAEPKGSCKGTVARSLTREEGFSKDDREAMLGVKMRFP